MHHGLNKCTTKEGYITIQDVNQDIVTIDFTDIILNAIDRLNSLLDFRLKQFEEDLDTFMLCFEKWFGKGHTGEEVQSIVNRMKAVQNHTAQMINTDGSLNESFFEIPDPSESYGVNAYVYSSKTKNKVIYLGPGSFSPNKPTTGFGTLAGTIAHELSHFEDIGATEDHAYWGEVQPLAKSAPSNALYNAASFSFFLESGETCDDYSSNSFSK